MAPRSAPSRDSSRAARYIPIQEGFFEEHGLQCGFCTPGMMMTSVAFLKDHPNPTDDEIRQAISGNLCRCTGYVNIVKVDSVCREKDAR